MNTPPYVDRSSICRASRLHIPFYFRPNGVITMVSSLATKVHKTLHSIETDETMVRSCHHCVAIEYLTLLNKEPLFTKEPNGQARKQKFIMGRRNWCSFQYNENSKDVVFDIRVEREKGGGITIGSVLYSFPLKAIS